jgi:hypothetical protein
MPRSRQSYLSKLSSWPARNWFGGDGRRRDSTSRYGTQRAIEEVGSGVKIKTAGAPESLWRVIFTPDCGPLVRRRIYRLPDCEGYAACAFECGKFILWRIIQRIIRRDLFQPFAAADRTRWGALGHCRIMARSPILGKIFLTTGRETQVHFRAIWPFYLPQRRGRFSPSSGFVPSVGGVLGADGLWSR